MIRPGFGYLIAGEKLGSVISDTKREAEQCGLGEGFPVILVKVGPLDEDGSCSASCPLYSYGTIDTCQLGLNDGDINFKPGKQCPMYKG